MRTLSIAAVSACLAAVITAAQATPITTPPPALTALGGDVQAVFVYASANDASILLTSGSTVIFCNKTITGTCTANSAGDSVDLGVLSGPQLFQLHDTTTGYIYDTANPDGNGDYHVDIRNAYTYAGVPALSSSLAAYLATLPNVTYVAFEDRQKSNGSDFDYNDLIFAFSNTVANVPEPLTLSLLGAGLLGVFGLRRRRKA